MVKKVHICKLLHGKKVRTYVSSYTAYIVVYNYSIIVKKNILQLLQFI